MNKRKWEPLEKFAFLELTEENVVLLATHKQLTTKQLGELVTNKIFSPSRSTDFIAILLRLIDEGYVKEKFKKTDSYYTITWKWRFKKLYEFKGWGFIAIIFAALALAITAAQLWLQLKGK